ncbi:hypothetical protein AB0896_05745 [Streptomyces parvulus]|uniref:hypothetical protein n=1 Tax=Streptomyces parvulus TaxID=146923 RepID=UPI0034555D8A
MQDVESLTPEQYELANRALACLDIAGFYCAKKYVGEKDFLDLWAPALVTLGRSAARPFWPTVTPSGRSPCGPTTGA